MEHDRSRDPRLASILHDLSQLTQTHTPTRQPPGDIAPAPKHALGGHSTGIPPGDALPAPSTRDPPRRPTPPRPDPTRITEWPSAVKFVMNHLSHSPEISSKIRRLVKNQHDNERQWWAGREALIEKHKGRVEGKKKMEDILISLGRAAGSPDLESPSWSSEEELERFGKKVYGALGHMVAAMDKELTTLKVPFFAIKHELIHDGMDEKPGTISKQELAELQRKMLQLLQDLFAD